MYSFIFRKLNEDPPREVARGTIAVVCVRRDPATGRDDRSADSRAIADKIEAAPAELLGCMTASDGYLPDRTAIESLQLGKLELLLAAVLAHNPFYSAKLRGAGVKPGLAYPARSLSPACRLRTSTSWWTIRQSTRLYGSNLTYPLKRTRDSTRQAARQANRFAGWIPGELGLDGRLLDRGLPVGGRRPARPGLLSVLVWSVSGFWVAFDGGGPYGLPRHSRRRDAQHRAPQDNPRKQVTVLCSTPSYALHLAEVAAEEKIDLTVEGPNDHGGRENPAAASVDPRPYRSNSGPAPGSSIITG